MTIASTPHGQIQGEEDSGIRTFMGVPFAAPPVGDLRFRAPEPPESWSGIRLADRPGPASVQEQHAIPGFSASSDVEEDCLYLNVFTPGLDANKRPVMVWIHGGAYTHGAGSEDLYSGVPLAKRGDVVVVSINYRLGALGFLHLGDHLPDQDVSSNLGLLDCIAALKWVRVNIESFGGDPANITIFGESAGAGLVGSLLAMPAAKGLFHRAILQSGQGRARPTELAIQTTNDLLADLEINPPDAAALLSIPAERIVAAQTRLSRKANVLSPVRDPKTLPEQPLMAIAAGAAEGVDLMIGHNRDELKLFKMAGGRRPPMTADEAIEEIRPSLPGLDDDALNIVLQTYRLSREANELSNEYLDLADAIIGDAMFRAGGIALAEAHANRGGRAFTYLFTHESPARGGSLGACHALEIPFVFGTIDQPSQQKFAGAGPKVKELSDKMMDAWISFARTGDPSTQGLGTWSPYDVEKRTTMVLGPNARAVNDPFSEERKVLTR